MHVLSPRSENSEHEFSKVSDIKRRPRRQKPLCCVFYGFPLSLVLISYKRLTLSKLTISVEQTFSITFTERGRGLIHSYEFLLPFSLIFNGAVEEELFHLFSVLCWRAAATVVCHAEHWLIVRPQPERPNWDRSLLGFVLPPNGRRGDVPLSCKYKNKVFWRLIKWVNT